MESQVEYRLFIVVFFTYEQSKTCRPDSNIVSECETPCERQIVSFTLWRQYTPIVTLEANCEKNSFEY